MTTPPRSPLVSSVQWEQPRSKCLQQMKSRRIKSNKVFGLTIITIRYLKECVLNYHHSVHLSRAPLPFYDHSRVKMIYFIMYYAVVHKNTAQLDALTSSSRTCSKSAFFQLFGPPKPECSIGYHCSPGSPLQGQLRTY